MTVGTTRVRQDYRLLPLGGHQYLVLAACAALRHHATARSVQKRLLTAGLPKATFSQIYITLQRLTARGLVKINKRASCIDKTRAVKVHMLTKHGREVLDLAHRNFRLVTDICRQLER
jgi:Fe2+ or Zn2+ uptake regulation protein